MAKPLPYKSVFSLSHQTLNQVASIMDKVGRISVLPAFQNDEHLQSRIDLDSVLASLEQEGNKLSPREISLVTSSLPYKTKKPNAKIIEAKALLGEYVSKSSYACEESFFLDSFRRINDLNQASSCYRDYDVDGYPSYTEIGKLMKGLFKWIASSKGRIHPLLLASVFQYEILTIHPFPSHNGVMARLYAKIILGSFNPVFYLSLYEKSVLENRSMTDESYKVSTKAQDSNMAATAFLASLDASLSALEEDAKKSVTESFSPQVAKLIKIMKKNTPYGALELMDRLSLKSRLALQKNYLTPALEAGLIYRSDPNNIRNRNQRYFKK